MKRKKDGCEVTNPRKSIIRLPGILFICQSQGKKQSEIKLISESIGLDAGLSCALIHGFDHSVMTGRKVVELIIQIEDFLFRGAGIQNVTHMQENSALLTEGDGVPISVILIFKDITFTPGDGVGVIILCRKHSFFTIADSQISKIDLRKQFNVSEKT